MMSSEVDIYSGFIKSCLIEHNQGAVITVQVYSDKLIVYIA